MFVVFYRDGSEYDGPVEYAPGWGVQAIVQPNQSGSGYSAIQRGDYYLWREDWGGIWQDADRDGLLMYFANYSGWQKVLVGETASDAKYEEITQRALAKKRELEQ